ncbi:cob(I)yrinic acid a,c-diamide adenosyltransferase [Candidatus Bipolaricaulota bacterium]|nr:cob(I)yrinic acid a,c-diamide adenosyltransferase [Candidatus Bipolaricaulota bacterium]
MEGSEEDRERVGGNVLVHTGEGKGKTTSAVGQIIRAEGHGLNTRYISFFKGNEERFSRGIFKVMKKLGIPVRNFVHDHPDFGRTSEEEARNGCRKGLKYLNSLFRGEDEVPDLLALDEVNIALDGGWIEEEEFISLLEMKPDNLELICTGRGAPESLIAEADLVSRIENVKHFYDEGVVQRPGYEY